MKGYLDLLAKIMREGEDRPDRTGVGTRSLFGERIEFNLWQGFPLMTTKKVPLRWVAEELFWFLRGETDNETLLAKGVDIWNEWADEETCAKFGRNPGDLGPIYGHQWRNFGGEYDEYGKPVGGVDQIERLVYDITNNPTSRRLIVTGWNPDEADKVSLPPCHTLFQCYVHTDGRLDLHLYARSIDAFLGLPFNIASYALLIRLLAHTCDLRPGALNISFGDVHVYSNHFKQVEEQLTREPRPRPLLLINAPFLMPWEYTWDHITIEGYDPHPKISAPVAV